MSLGVIVIEAKEKKWLSDNCTSCFRTRERSFFSLPGNINSIFSKGTNKLIKDGAKLIMDIDDIIEEIYELQEKIKTKKRRGC